MASLFRSFVFVPGNNARFLDKAQHMEADVVCLDLEDSVPAAQKLDARKMIAESLGNPFKADVYVRTNSPASKMIHDDLDAITLKGLDGVTIPKVDTVQQVRQVEDILSKLEKDRGLEPIGIIPSIESALSVVNCYAIASCTSRIRAVVFGVFDLMSDMKMEHDPDQSGAVHARTSIPLLAQAAGVLSIDSIYQNTKDEQGLRKDCKIGRGMGYTGKSTIHPDQIPTVHEIFAPTESEKEWARRIRSEYEKAVDKGRGAVSIDGCMIDEVHYKRACTLLDM